MPLFGWIKEIMGASMVVKIDFDNSAPRWRALHGLTTFSNELVCSGWTKVEPKQEYVDTAEVAAYYHAVVGE